MAHLVEHSLPTLENRGSKPVIGNSIEKTKIRRKGAGDGPNIFLFLNGPNPASFLFIFVLFTIKGQI